MLSTVAAAGALFAATNIDDIVVLTVLFVASTRGRPRPWQIVAGQYLGFSTLLAVSFVAALGLGVVPEEWVGLLGLIPLALGLVGLARSLRSYGEDDDASSLAAVGLLGVAGITIANGGDNIAIYTPVFRTMSLADATVTIVVFLVLVAVWCAAGRLIGTHTAVIEALERVERWLVPVVFIGLGFFILIEAGTLQHVADLL